MFFLLLPVLLVSHPRNHYRVHRRDSPVFLSDNRLILAGEVRSLVHSGLAFAPAISWGPTSAVLRVAVQSP